MPTRDDIGLATCKRLLGVESGIPGVRVSAPATVQAQAAVMQLLVDAGIEAAKLLKLKKAKTVKFDVIAAIFADNKCLGIRGSDLASAPRKGKGQRGLPLRAVERVFREQLPQGSRLSEEAGKALVGAAEAYLHNLGKNAGLMALAAKRNTLQGADVLAARKIRM